MIDYIWSVKNMEVYTELEGNPDVVFCVAWECVGKENLGTIVVSNNIAFIPANFAGQPFIPYDQLTQNQVLDWVFSVIDKSGVEAKIAEQIQEQKTPKTQVLPLPWMNS